MGIHLTPYPPRYTTVQRDLLGAFNGQVIYNTTTGQLESYNGAAWVAVGTVYGDATFIPLTQKAAASGVASLNASSKVVQDPATAYLPTGGGTMAGALDMDSQQLQNVVLQHAGLYPFPTAFRPAAGAWYRPLGISGYSAGGGALTANRLYAQPIWIPVAESLDRIGVNIQTAGAAGALIRMGLYAAGSLPVGLEFDAGTLSAEATGPQTITITQTKGPGLFWVAWVCNDATIKLYLNTGSYLALADGPFQAMYDTTGHYYVAHTFGALPDPFGTPIPLTSQYHSVGLRRTA